MTDALEAIADAIDLARYQHPEQPRERPRPFSEADRSDREYTFRLARAALAAAQAGAETVNRWDHYEQLQIAKREGFAAGIEAAVRETDVRGLYKTSEAIRTLRPPAAPADEQPPPDILDPALCTGTATFTPPSASEPAGAQSRALTESEAQAMAGLDHWQKYGGTGPFLSDVRIVLETIHRLTEPAGSSEEAFTEDELNRLRQWYNAIDDNDPNYLDQADMDLATKVTGQLALLQRGEK